MEIFIYSRKSKFTGKGESTENQIQLGREYAQKHFDVYVPDENIFEDEGYSGGTMDRPAFQRLLKAVKTKAKKGIPVKIICYRLDRFSRSVVDFSTTMEELQKYGAGFVSIREQFDTSTPMGRAMMYIASVFAQLERETAAERIRDNMIQLAKTGRWLGGITPTGFRSQPISYLDPSGKERMMYQLSPIQEELETVKLIYNKFLELRSLTQLESYCIVNNIKTKNGADYTRFSLKAILQNPVYAIADETLYEYLIENGYDVYSPKEEFTGEFGLMAYNKTNQDKKSPSNRFRDVSEWIVAIGAHVGAINSKDWIRTQHLLMQNKSKSYRKVRNSTCLLSGILKCASCGSYMRPKMGKTTAEGEVLYYYTCELKIKSKRTKCNVKNLQANNFDRLVIGEIKKLSSQNSVLFNTIKQDKINIQTSQNDIEKKIDFLEKKIQENKISIDNLIASLAQGQGQNSAAAKYILDQINLLDQKTGELKSELLKLKAAEEANKNKEISLDAISDMLSAFENHIDIIDIEAKRAFLKGIVERITWDGLNAEMTLFGCSSEKKPMPPMV